MEQMQIDQVFHPERPVTEERSLVGRDMEVEKAVQRLSTHGGHVLLSGNRGIGKTSVARVAESVLRKLNPDYMAHYIPCDSITRFSDIAESCILDTPNLIVTNIPASPAKVASLLAPRPGFLLLDEIDLMQERERVLLAEFMKALSDQATKFSVCVIGVARTATEIFAGHLSVHRCLNEINVRRLDDREIQRIVVDGFEKLGYAVPDGLSTDVAKLSRGFPSNAVLLCRYVAEHLARRNLPALDESGFDQGLHSFLDERGRATREVLTRIAVHDKLRHKQAIMFAAGLLELDEFTYDELLIAAKSRAAIEKRVFENVCLTFCIEGPEQVFGNPRAGLLRFLDPRMPMILHVMEYLRLGRG